MATTEVNRCSVCSYVHTKIALEAGIEKEEVQAILAGIKAEYPKEELPGILFAQHYADSKGKPSLLAWEEIKGFYGTPTALGILGAVRIIMLGNAIGIPMGSLFTRFRGKPDERSSISYEIAVMLMCPVYLPIAAAHAAIAGLSKKPMI